MLKRLLLLIIVSLIFNNHLFISAEQKAFQTNIKLYQGGKYLLAAPAIVEVKIRNNSDKDQKIPAQEGIWFIAGNKCGIEQIGHLPTQLNKNENSPPYPTVPSGWEKILYYDLATECDLKKIGQYELEYRIITSVYSEVPALPSKIIIELQDPIGIDKQAYEELDKDPLGHPNELLEKYPTSTYAGWALINWKPELPGVFVVNESANYSIMAAINKNANEINKWWKLKIPLSEGEKEVDRTKMMRNLAEIIESFVNAHQDSQFSGYLTARAGFNLLGLAEFQKACYMLNKSLALGWDLPKCNKECMKHHIEGTKNALGILIKNKLCT